MTEEEVSYKDDQKPLLSSYEKYTDIQIIKPTRRIVLEPLILLYFAGAIGVGPIISQYVYVAYGKQHNFTQAGIGNNNDTINPCNLTNDSNAVYKLQQEIQGESSIFMLYLTACSGVPALFSGLYLGGYTDQKGRKIGILIPLLGGFLRMLTYTLVMFFQANIYFLFIGAFLDGMCGYFSLFIAACFAYISDSTTREQRALRISITELFMAIGSSASAGFGFWLKASGFIIPMVFITCLCLVCLFYTFFFVPETIVSDPRKSVSITIIAKNAYEVYFKDKESGRPCKLLLLLLAITLVGLSAISSSGVMGLYYMNSPFCFDSIEIGLFGGISAIGIAVGSAAALMVFMKCLKLSDLTVSLLASITGVIKYTMYGLANTKLMLWLTIPVGCMQFLSIPLIRARMSKLVLASEQGSLFAGIACFEIIVCNVLGTLLWNLVYKETLALYTGFVFLLMALSVFFSVIVIGIVKYKLYKEEKQFKGMKDLKRNSLNYGSTINVS